MSGYRNPFTADEERKILNYIFRNNGFYRLRGLQFWRELEKDEFPCRTYQSLHERFRKFIITNLQNPAYDLSYEEQLKLKRIYEDTGRGKKATKTVPPLPVCSTSTEEQGNLARNFFEISDSDDSDGGHSMNTLRKSNSGRNKGRTGSNDNTSNKTMRNEDEKSTEEEKSVSTMNLSTSVVEIDSSSDSEIFSLI